MRKEEQNSFDIDTSSMSLSVAHDTKKSISNPTFSRTPSVKESSFERLSSPSLNPLQA